MSASINDKIVQAENGGAPEPTTVSTARSISGTSLSCVALTNWPTDTGVHLITYKKKTDGSMDRDTLCLWKGIVSGTTIGTLTLKGGTDAGNDVGDFVEMAPTSALWQDLYDGLTQTLNTDGTLKTGIVTSSKIADGAVGTDELDDAAVTPGKRSGGYATGTFTCPASTGNKAVTGLGFTPKRVRFTITFTTATVGQGCISIGTMDASGSQQSVAIATRGSTGSYSEFKTDSCIYFVTIGGSGSSSVSAKAAYVSMDSDGFTINFSTTNAAYSGLWEADA